LESRNKGGFSDADLMYFTSSGEAWAERMRERSDDAILAGEFSAAAPGPNIDSTKTERTDESDVAQREINGVKPASDWP
jgi:hypothetical protein